MANRVAFIGLGTMGYPMAGHLARRFETLVWNRTASKAQAHAQQFGSYAVTDLRETAAAEFLFTCLPTSVEVEAILEQLLPALKPGTLWVDCTSGDPQHSRRLAQRLRERGCDFLDAPVSGGKAGAEAGTLTVMVGGSRESYERALPVIGAFAGKVFHVGDVGAGHAVKAVNNMLLAIGLLSAAEGLATLAKLGVDPAVALEVINVSSGRSFSTEVHFPERVLTRQFPNTFSLALLAKDTRIAVAMAREAYVPAPLMQLAAEMFEMAKAQ
ncbi:MAG: NAD(P)-dependent oxidoreductase, partial [Armatimonadota bacterium]|nr:NAD(P)-dependent oxidoreductase [Armatimonadota bacterium]